MEMPSDLSGFGQIWHLDTEALSQSEQDQVAGFVAGGRGVYLTGEWGCCAVDNSTIALINRLVSGATVSHGGRAGDLIQVAEDAPFGLGVSPHRVDSVLTSMPGSLANVDPGNVVGTVGSAAVITAWADGEVQGSGRLVSVMDINWVAEQYRGDSWGRFIENLARFLSG